MYKRQDIYAGVPVIIGKNGVEKVIEIELSPEEKKQFDSLREKLALEPFVFEGYCN